MPDPTDLLGYAASALVLLAFSLQSPVALRVVAIASNVCFIAYAADARVPPVLVLHLLLLPVNAYRLRESLHAVRRGPTRAGARADEPPPLNPREFS